MLQSQQRFLSAAAEPKDERIFIDWNGWGLLFLAVQTFNFGFFLVGYFCLHISIIDISWGLMPIIPLTMLLVERIVILGVESISAIQIIVYVLISIWGLRLASLIARRYHGADERYVELEKFDAGCPQPLRGVAICIKIFAFQAGLSVVITDPAIKIFYFSKPEDTIGALEIVGIILWCIGFFFEVVGDQQLTDFVNSPNKVPG